MSRIASQKKNLSLRTVLDSSIEVVHGAILHLEGKNVGGEDHLS